jgi:uncharacterized protein
MSIIEPSSLSLGAVRASKGPPPVHLWNPPFCGRIDMVIKRDGTWFHEGSPIGRLPMVKLFASILRKDGESFRLVTPVEMVEISVEDAPFIGVDMDVEGGSLIFRTQLDDRVVCDAAHPLRFIRDAQGGYRPYLMVRHGLEARLNRHVHGLLMAQGEVRNVDSQAMFGVASAGCFFPIAPASELEAP